MRVIGSFKTKRVVNDDSILTHVESEFPETVKWGDVKQTLHDEMLVSHAEVELQDSGVCYLPQGDNVMGTYRLVV